MPLDKLADMTNLKLNPWLVAPAVRLALEIKVEKPALQFAAIIGVKMRPMLEPVAFEPFLFRGCPDKPLEIAARMQALPAPIRRRQKRHRDLAPVGRPRSVVIIVEGMGEDFVAEAGTVTRQFFIRKSLVATDQFAGHRAARPSFAETILNGLDLHVVPVGPERRHDAAVMRHVAIPVGRPLPDTHRLQMRRLERSDVPLVDAVIRHAVQADIAVGPGLNAGPLDALIEIAGLARRNMIDRA